MSQSTPLQALESIELKRDHLTPKGRMLADYILRHARRVMFMTTRELAEASHVSEATVVRFVSQLGYHGYGAFLQALRDAMDTDLTLLDRFDLTDRAANAVSGLRQVVFEEIDNLRQLLESVDQDTVDNMVTLMNQCPQIYVVGSRLSFTFAHYMGWSLTKVRDGIHILKGSDSTTIDWLTLAPRDSLVVMIATSRYPNELIRIARLVRRMELTLLLLTDAGSCPVIQFAHHTLVTPSRHIPFTGSLAALSCLINFLIRELAKIRSTDFKTHQERLEQAYWENDVLFNLRKEI